MGAAGHENCSEGKDFPPLQEGAASKKNKKKQCLIKQVFAGIICGPFLEREDLLPAHSGSRLNRGMICKSERTGNFTEVYRPPDGMQTRPADMEEI